MYTEEEARKLVLRAGLELVEKKLIARTWGNISARISDSQFVITPSGRSYESLKPEDLVIVGLDCSYSGDIKPSSEKGVHADVYRLRPEANFIIHTHQHFASAVCVEGKDTDFAPCAGYGLPGTKKLREQVEKSLLANPGKQAFLMERHGALCFGSTYEEAFQSADELERACEKLYLEKRKAVTDQQARRPYIDDYAQIAGFGGMESKDEDPEAVRIIKAKNATAAEYADTAKPMCFFDVLLQHLTYKLKYSKLKNKS